jgi:hypothetical protein
MFKLIKQLFKGFLMFGLPMLMTIGMWVILDPATFWQTLTTVIVNIIVYFVSFAAVCLILNELGE